MMFDEASAAELLKAIKSTREDLAKTADERNKAFKAQQDDIKKFGAATSENQVKTAKIAEEFTGLQVKLQGLEDGLNELHKRLNRPPGGETAGDAAERKEAVEWRRLVHESRFHKIDPENKFAPTEDQIQEAMTVRKAVAALMHTTDMNTMPEEYRKSLSAFNFGNNGFIMSPEMSNRVLSCLLDITDIAGLMNSVTIAGPSIRFMIDNVIFDQAAWACETSCFANNPQPNLAGLGEMEIKPETLRYIVCVTRDILEDASINVEAWMLAKVARAFRATISNALISGDGVGRPVGILNPNSGIPICDTAPTTPPGTFTWQDLVALKWAVPIQYHGGFSRDLGQTGGVSDGRYFMNQNTFGLILTMSDGFGRPIWGAMPENSGMGLSIAGSPITIVTQFPDVAPGATPVAWGNWREVYMMVYRKAVTMQQDPYSAGFCLLYKWEARVGGGIICPGAARLLRIR